MNENEKNECKYNFFFHKEINSYFHEFDPSIKITNDNLLNNNNLFVKIPKINYNTCYNRYKGIIKKKFVNI